MTNALFWGSRSAAAVACFMNPATMVKVGRFLIGSATQVREARSDKKHKRTTQPTGGGQMDGTATPKGGFSLGSGLAAPVLVLGWGARVVAFGDP